MIRYKVMCENNTLLCEKRENKDLLFIKIEQTFIEIVNLFIENGYTITINGKDMILNGSDSYIYLQDYGKVLSSLCLASLRNDILKRVENDGVLTPLPKKKGNKNKRSKRNKEYTLELPEITSDIKYYSKKKKFMFKTYLHHFAEYALLATLSLGLVKTPSVAADNIYKNHSIVDEQINNEASYNMTINDALDLRPISSGIDAYRFDEAYDQEDVEEVVETSLPVEENHDDEYREAIYNFLVKEEMTLDQFSQLLTAMVEGNSMFSFNYKSEAEVFKDLCFREERSIEEKMLITMIRDNVLYDELDSVCASCVSESCNDGECYEDAYAVASVFLNRMNDVYYVGSYGTNPFNQLTAPGQFSVYSSGDYTKYLGRRDLPAYQAAVDALYSRKSSHNYLEFRANWVQLDHYESFATGGNKFIVRQKDSRVLTEEEFQVDKNEVMKLSLDY